MDPPFGFVLDITSLRWTKLAIPVLVNHVYHKAMFLDNFVVVFGGAVYEDGKLKSSCNNIVLWNIDNGTTNIVPVNFPLWGFYLLEGLLPNKHVMAWNYEPIAERGPNNDDVDSQTPTRKRKPSA